MIKIPSFKKTNLKSQATLTFMTSFKYGLPLKRKAEVKIVTQTFHYKNPASGAISVDRGAENL